MVLSRPPDDLMRSFSTENGNYLEVFMDEERLSGRDLSIIPSGQQITDDVTSRCHSRILDITIRRETGNTEIYPWESMTNKRRHQMLEELHELASADGRGAEYNEGSPHQAKRRRQSLGFSNHDRTVNGDQSRRGSGCSDSSSCGRAQRDREHKVSKKAQRNKRKRARRTSLDSGRFLEEPRGGEIDALSMTGSEKLMICDEKAVMEFYRRILADGQQGLCKKLAKWWIRAINPNKQTNYPYAKGHEKCPPWWPLTPPTNAVGQPVKGTKENGFVRHKEPDHLAKPERLTLLPYMLNQVTDPRNRKQFNSIDVAKLHQISIDSINNEATDKDKHESWRRFVNEIFRVALQQESYKNGETDESTTLIVSRSFDSWRHKGPVDEAEEASKSDEEYDDGESDNERATTPKSISDSDPRIQDHAQLQSLADGIKQEYSSSYTHDARFPLNFHPGIGDQSPCRSAIETSGRMPNPPSYSTSTVPLSRSYHQPNPMLLDSFRRHPDTSDRFSSQSTFYPYLPNTNMAHVNNPQYQAIQSIFQPPMATDSPIGPSHLPPSSLSIARPLTDMQQFSVFHENGLMPRSITEFQPSTREPILGSQGNLLRHSHQQPNFQDYVSDQDYGHSAHKMHLMSLNNTARPEFTYDQENESNSSRSELIYSIKTRCSLEPVAFDLNDMVLVRSNCHSEDVR